MTRVRHIAILLGVPCASAVLLTAHGAAAQTCVPLPSAPGSLDTCFGVNGYVETDVTGTGEFQATESVHVDGAGRIVVGGYSRVAGSTGTELFVARYVPDGSALDTTFGGTGVVKTRLTTSTTDSEVLRDLTVQSNGQIVVAAQMPPASKKGTQMFAVLRYNGDGTLDSSFGTAGIVSFSFANGTDAWLRALAIQPDGKIVVAGESGSALAVARLTASGAFDTTFGTGGKATFASIVDRRQGPSIYAMALDPGGKPVLVGGLYQKSLIVRLTSSGALDTSFASRGWTTIDYAGGQDDYFTSVTIDSSGRIVAAGRADTPVNRAPPLTDMGLARFLPTGALDLTFGTGGKVVQDINGTFDVVHGLAIETDGHIIVSAEATAMDYTSSDTAVSRFNGNGTLDTSFGVNGFTLTTYPFAFAFPYGLAVQNDNGVMKVVVLEGVNQSRLVGLTRYLW